MNVNDILQQLREERQRIDSAISALQGIDSATSVGTVRRGRPAGTTTGTQPRRRRMSAAARAKIAAAARARWARQKGTTCGEDRVSEEEDVCSGETRSPADEPSHSEAHVRDDEGAVGRAEEEDRQVKHGGTRPSDSHPGSPLT
jgi:hypothetical protein